MLNQVEKECQDALKAAHEYVWPNSRSPKQKRDRYMVLGMLAEALRKLHNKSFGCPSGLHAGECLCTNDAPGVTFRTAKRNAREGHKHAGR